MIKIQGVSYLSDFEAKKYMIEAASRLAAKSYVMSTDGSLSVRTGPNTVWITTENGRKDCLKQEQLVKVDMEGHALMGARTLGLSEDISYHLDLYKRNPEVQAVIHGYPPAACMRGMKGEHLEGSTLTKTLRKLGSVLVIEEREFGKVQITGNGGIIIRNGGCFGWGRTPLEAFDMLQGMEYLSGMEPIVPKGVTEMVYPSLKTSDVIHSMKKERTKVTEKPKETVMADVVRMMLEKR